MTKEKLLEYNPVLSTRTKAGPEHFVFAFNQSYSCNYFYIQKNYFGSTVLAHALAAFDWSKIGILAT